MYICVQEFIFFAHGSSTNHLHFLNKKMFPFVPSRIRIFVAINRENRPLFIDDHVEVQNIKKITKHI